MAIELPPAYYLDNFIELIDFVANRYTDLLSLEEVHFRDNFLALDENAQKLYVRMLTRKGDIFRISKLQYREIENSLEAARSLAAENFIEFDSYTELADILGLFSRADWLHLLKKNAVDVSSFKKLKRQAFDLALLAYYNEAPLPNIDDGICLIRQPKIFETFKLLFFGNLHQDLSEFVLRDLALYRYENYVIDQQTRVFHDREQVLRHLACYETLASLDAVLTSDPAVILDFYSSLPKPGANDPVLTRRVNRACFQLARQLERCDALDAAMEIYQHLHTPEARERMVRILTKQGRINHALALCDTIIPSPLTEAEADFASNFAYRIAKKYKMTRPAPQRYSPPTEQITLPECDSVELGVCDFFSSVGECYYVENAIFCSIFGLYYWNVIFSSYRGAFTHPFQMRPHDLYDHSFIESRKALFSALKKKTDSLDVLKKQVFQTWEEKSHKASSLLYWDIIEEPLLHLLFARIPLQDWLSIFDRMWSDLRSNRNGFPDLIFFPKASGYTLIEVKGPGDRLQKNQLRWMQHFHKYGIPHKVVNVEWH